MPLRMMLIFVFVLGLVACGGGDSSTPKRPTMQADGKGASTFEQAGEPAKTQAQEEKQPEAAEPDKPTNGGADEADKPLENSIENLQPSKAALPEDTLTFEGGLKVYLTEGEERVEVVAEVLGDQRHPLEFLVVGWGGAKHEALFGVGCKASHLKDGLELLGLNEGKEKLSFRGEDKMPDGDKVQILVRWINSKGERKEAPIEDWVFNRRTEKQMTRGPWIFTGARSALRADTGRMTFEADFTGNIVSTWRDPGTVIDNPRPHGLDSQAYTVHPTRDLSPPSTQVMLIIRPWKE